MEYADIPKYYLEMSQMMVDEHPKEQPFVLKTDLHNETNKDSIPILGNLKHFAILDAIELDSLTVKKARASHKGYNITIRNGDIRKLPYLDNYYDLILDLSTVDHVLPDELERVIKEYNRVLKIDGRLLLIIWTNPTRDIYMPEQTYFSEDRVAKTVKGYFEPLKTPKRLLVDGENTLIELQLKKRSVLV